MTTTITTTNTLYLDMDGVLADFNGFAQELLGVTDQERSQAALRGRWTPDQWTILKTQQDLYRSLPRTEWANDLVTVARKFRNDLGWNLGILTAIPKNNDVPRAFQHKIEWVQEYYPDLPVYFGPYSKDKRLHCQSGDILVDDREDNCLDWNLAGGLAIRVWDSNPRAALEELSQIYKELGASIGN